MPSSSDNPSSVLDLRSDAGEILSAIEGALFNRQTGMGTQFSAVNNIQVGCAPLLREQDLRTLYRGNWWIRRIVDTPARDMTRKGVEVKILDGGDEEAVAAVMAKYSDTNPTDSPFESEYSIDQAKEDAIRWARLFGRAYIICHVNGGEDSRKPLKRVRSFDGVTVLDRYQLRPALGERNLFNPEFYEVVVSRNIDSSRTRDLKMPWGTIIHKSRVLPYDGNRIHPYDLQLDGDGGHDSVVQSLFEIFLRYYQAKDAVSEALNSFSLFVATINGLAGIIGGPNGVEVLKQYIQTLNIQRSVYRTVVRDGEAGNTDFVERSFQGVAENVKAIADELTAASDLPHYKIWGSEDNANALSTGGAESRAYAEKVGGWQWSGLRPNDRRLFKMLFQAETGEIPKRFELEYPSIYEPTPQELADMRKSDADTYSILVDSQIIIPAEAKLAIATGQPIENVLDEEEVRDELEKEKERASKTGELKDMQIEEMLNPPEPVDATVPGAVPEGTPSLEDVSTMLDSADIRIDAPRGGRSSSKGRRRGTGSSKSRKNCEKGITCGGSCISRTKVCRKDGNATQKAVAKKIRANAGGGAAATTGQGAVSQVAPDDQPTAGAQPITPNQPEVTPGSETTPDEFFQRDAVEKLASVPGQDGPPSNATIKAEDFNPYAQKKLTPQEFADTLLAKQKLSVQDDPAGIWNKTFADSGLSKTAYKNEILSAMRQGQLPTDESFVRANFNKTQQKTYDTLKAQVAQDRQIATRYDRAINHPLVSDRVAAMYSPQMSRAQAEAFANGSFLGGLTMYHGNSQRVADGIRTNGSQPERNNRGIYGQGTYFGALKSTGELYANSASTSSAGGNVGMVAVKTNVRNPFVTDRAQLDQISQFFPGSQSNNIDSVAVTQYMRARGFDSIYLKDQGYLISFDGRQTTTFQYTDFSRGTKAFSEMQRRESSYSLQDRTMNNEAAAYSRLVRGTNLATLSNTETRDFGVPADDFAL